MKTSTFTLLIYACMALPMAHAAGDDATPTPLVGEGATASVLDGRAQLGARATGLTPAERHYASRESALIQEIRLLDLELEVAERKAKLGEARSPAAPIIHAPQPAAQAATIAHVASAPANPPAPTIRLLSTWGTPGALRAEVRFGSIARTVSEGDLIAAGTSIKSIRAGEIEILEGGRVKTLGLDP